MGTYSYASFPCTLDEDVCLQCAGYVFTSLRRRDDLYASRNNLYQSFSLIMLIAGWKSGTVVEECGW